MTNVSSATDLSTGAGADQEPSSTVAGGGESGQDGATGSIFDTFGDASDSAALSSGDRDVSSQASPPGTTEAGSGPPATGSARGNTTETVTLAGSGLVFVNTYSASVSQSYKNAIKAAENFYQSEITTSVTLDFTFDTFNDGGSGFVAANSWYYVNVDYTTLKNALTSHATTLDDKAAVASLPATDITGGQGFSIPTALARALGLLPATSSSTDDIVYLNSADTYFYDQGSPAAGEFDATGALEHEISEGMGRVGGLDLGPNDIWGILDLFRYSASGTRDLTGGLDGKAAYFSIDGANLLTQFHNPLGTSGVNDGDDSGDWEISGDSFGFATTGEANTVSSTDLRLMDVIGWTPATGSSVVAAFQTPRYALANFSVGAGGWTTDTQFPRELADVNGDGLDDIVGFGYDGTWVSLATGGGNFAAPTLVLDNFGTTSAAGGWSSDTASPRVLGDVNGDGLADIVGFGYDGVWVSLATGGGNFAAPTLALDDFGSSSAAGGWTSSDPRELADVNGDGLDDIVGFGPDGVWVSLATGGGDFAAPTLVLDNFGSSAAAGGWTSQDQYPRELADVNGDGMADIVGFGQDGVWVSLATGGGDFAAPKLVLSDYGSSTAAGGWSSDSQSPRELADVNGDGKTDIVGFASGGTWVSHATGNGGFDTPALEDSNFGQTSATGGWTSQDAYPRRLGDVTGDKKADIVGFGSNGVYVAASTDATSSGGGLASSGMASAPAATVVTIPNGDQVLSARGNPEIFDFSHVSLGIDTIGGFDPTRDAIRLGSGEASDFATVRSDMRSDAGGTLIALGANHTITLTGIDPASLSAANFRFG